jgi:YceI-like domain
MRRPSAKNLTPAGEFPVISFTSTAVRQSGSDLELDGDLRIRDVTAPVTLEFEANGFIADPYGSVRSGFSAHRGGIDASEALGRMMGYPGQQEARSRDRALLHDEHRVP